MTQGLFTQPIGPHSRRLPCSGHKAASLCKTAALLCGLLLGGCAALEPAPAPPTQLPQTVTMQQLSSALEAKVQAVLNLHGPLASRVEQVPDVGAEIDLADLDPDIVRAGFAVCFTAAGNQACGGASVAELNTWATNSPEGIKAMVDRKLSELSALRLDLAQLLRSATDLVTEAAQRKIEADLLVTKAYQDVETLTVNPLEASRVKAGVQAGLHQLLASRAALDKLLTRVEVEVRPLTDKSHALRNQVLISIERFGDAS